MAVLINLKREKRPVGFSYSIQAQLLMNRLKNFNVEDFERDYAEGIIIGDKVIVQYVLEQEIKKNDKEKKENGS